MWRKPNQAVRSREHLTPDEVERMIVAGRQRGRYGNRDALLIMLAYRHGPGYASDSALPWAQEHSAHGQIYRAESAAV